jgi:uncharacterized membrane protein
MIQRIQTVWMALTVALVCVVMFSPLVTFSMGGADFRLMSYGIAGGDGATVAVLAGEDTGGGIVTSTLSICVAVLLALSALVPLVTIFLFRRRGLQARLLGVEFALLLGAAAFTGWYVWSTSRNVVAGLSENFFFSFYPLLLIVAMLTNWFAIRGVLRDEIMVRAADRIR